MTIELTRKEVRMLRMMLKLDLGAIGFSAEEQETLDNVLKKLRGAA